MKNSLNKNLIERYSRQIVLKNVGIAGQKAIINSKVLIVGAGGLGCPIADYLSRAGVGTIGIADHDKVCLSNIHRQPLYSSKDVGVAGQKTIINSKVLIVGAGGLGCPIADYLSRAGVGTIGIADHDKVSLSNIHRQSLYDSMDVGKFKVNVLKEKIKSINHLIKIKIIKKKITYKNFNSIIKNFDIIIDGSDNFKTKFLLNKYSIKYKKILIVGAISKFDGHVFSFDFKNKKTPCLKCFYQSEPSDEILNCEAEGILGPVAGIIGNIQANEVLKKILSIGSNLDGSILIINLLKLNFRKVSYSKKKNCICSK